MREQLRNLIEQALRGAVEAGELALAEIPEPHLEAPREQSHGDLATNVALLLARSVRKPPREIALAILRHFDDPKGIVQSHEIAGPGFINFSFSEDVWRRRLVEIVTAGAGYGLSTLGGGRRVQIEFCSANPTGPLHIGHGRGAATGDALALVLEAVGFRVEREYYINDAGRQMELLGRSVRARYLNLYGVETPFPQDGYPGDYVMQAAHDLCHLEGDRWVSVPEAEAVEEIGHWAGERMLERIKKDLHSFGVRFDHFSSERAIRDVGAVDAVLADLQERGHAYEQDGALWFRARDFGDDKDRPLARKDGTPTYFAADLAYHREKFRKGYEQVVNVWGADHHGYVKRMAAGLAALGYPAECFRVVLVQMVNLTRDGVPVRMGKRSGEFVSLSEVLDEVGPDLARFFFLMRRSDAQLEFDLELARRQSAENPVFYVQYAHTRIAGIFRQAAERGVETAVAGSRAVRVLGNNDELALIRLLDAFPATVESAARSLEPHRIVFYAQRLAGEFHRFYTRNKCVSDDPDLSAARLLLVAAVKQVIGRALALAGVSAPERM